MNKWKTAVMMTMTAVIIKYTNVIGLGQVTVNKAQFWGFFLQKMKVTVILKPQNLVTFHERVTL